MNHLLHLTNQPIGLMAIPVQTSTLEATDQLWNLYEYHAIEKLSILVLNIINNTIMAATGILIYQINYSDLHLKLS